MALCAWSASMMQAETADSLALQEIVVTGTRNATDVRHLPMTVTVVGREKLTEQHQASVLPTVMQEVPGLFVTSRAMMGYGVSTGAAGGINLRGITGGAGQLMVQTEASNQNCCGTTNCRGVTAWTVASPMARTSFILRATI